MKNRLIRVMLWSLTIMHFQANLFGISLQDVAEGAAKAMGDVVGELSRHVRNIDKEIAEKEHLLSLKDRCGKTISEWNSACATSYKQHIQDEVEKNSGYYSHWDENRWDYPGMNECCALTEPGINFDVEKKTLESLIESKVNYQKLQTRAQDMGFDAMSGFIKNQQDAANLDMDIQKIQASKLAEGYAANQGALERLKYLTEYFKNPETLRNIGIATVAITAGVIVAYYSGKLGYRYIESKMGVPDLITATSRKSVGAKLKESLKYNVLGYEVPKIEKPSEKIIFSDEIKNRTNNIFEQIKQAKELNLELPNVLLYGAPGTGKTALAQAWADACGLEWHYFSAANFAQFKKGEGIIKLNDLLRWSKSQTLPSMIIVDEAEAGFADRKTLTEEGKKLVTAFLAQTGANTNKYMFVFITNHADEIDCAVRNRMDYKVEIPCPGPVEVEKIFNQKIKNYIESFQEKCLNPDTGEDFVRTIYVAKEIDADLIKKASKELADIKTPGRTIEKLVLALRGRALLNKCVLDKNIFESVLNDKKSEIIKENITNDLQHKLYLSKLNALGVSVAAGVQAAAAA